MQFVRVDISHILVIHGQGKIPSGQGKVRDFCNPSSLRTLPPSDCLWEENSCVASRHEKNPYVKFNLDKILKNFTLKKKSPHLKFLKSLRPTACGKKIPGFASRHEKNPYVKFNLDKIPTKFHTEKKVCMLRAFPPTTPPQISPSHFKFFKSLQLLMGRKSLHCIST